MKSATTYMAALRIMAMQDVEVDISHVAFTPGHVGRYRQQSLRGDMVGENRPNVVTLISADKPGACYAGCRAAGSNEFNRSGLICTPARLMRLEKRSCAALNRRSFLTIGCAPLWLSRTTASAAA